MNEVMNAILSRRSIRAFTEEKVDQELLEEIVKAGAYAPSSLNNQPWHFTVISNKEVLDKLNFDTKEVIKSLDNEKFKALGNNEKFNVFYNAPVAIIVSGEEADMMSEVDCAAATENMLIAAESLGIGSCWIGFVTLLFKGEKGEEYRKEFGIKDGYKPYFAIVLGHKKVEGANAPKRKEGTVTYIK